MEGTCCRGCFLAQAQSQFLQRKKAPPCWARSSRLTTCAACQNLPTPASGNGKGQSPKDGVDCLVSC